MLEGPVSISESVCGSHMVRYPGSSWQLYSFLLGQHCDLQVRCPPNSNHPESSHENKDEDKKAQIRTCDLRPGGQARALRTGWRTCNFCSETVDLSLHTILAFLLVVLLGHSSVSCRPGQAGRELPRKDGTYFRDCHKNGDVWGSLCQCK